MQIYEIVFYPPSYLVLNYVKRQIIMGNYLKNDNCTILNLIVQE